MSPESSEAIGGGTKHMDTMTGSNICPYMVAIAGDTSASDANEKTNWDESRREEPSLSDKGHQRIRYLKETWKIVNDQLGVKATQLFYQRLFEIDPSLERLFEGVPIEVQSEKLLKTLDMAVKYVDHLHVLSF